MLMPLPIHLAHRLVEQLAELRAERQARLAPPGRQEPGDGRVRGRAARRASTPSSSRTQHDESVLDKKKDVISEKAKQEIIEQVIKPVHSEEAAGTTTSSSTSTRPASSSSAARTATPA